MSTSKPKIGVLVEAHFDETEYRVFGDFFPKNGYEVEYLSYLWNQSSLDFIGNDFNQDVTVNRCVTKVEPTDYKGLLLIGGYAMDRLRYEEKLSQDGVNRAPAVEFLRKAVAAMDEGKLKIGTICHSLWLFCADPSLIKGRTVTCAHNIICDVRSAGGVVPVEDGQTKEINIDGGLISGRHPGVVETFVDVFLRELKEMG